MTVWPCHHGNPLSPLLVTHIVCAECSAVPPRYLYSLHHESVAVCSIGMSEELLICGAPRSHTPSNTFCQIRAAARRLVWSLAMRVGLNETGSGCLLFMSFSPYCWSITTQPRAQPSSTGLRASVPSHTWPLTPTFRTSHSPAMEKPQTPPSPSEHLPFCSLHQVLHCSHHSITRHSSWSSHACAFIAGASLHNRFVDEDKPTLLCHDLGVRKMSV